MKAIFTFLFIAFVSISCQKGADVDPTPEPILPKATFRVTVSLYDQFNQHVATENIGWVEIVLTSQRLQKDTILTISSFASSQIAFENVPAGEYKLTVHKEGYVGENRLFKLNLEAGQFKVEDLLNDRKIDLPEYGNLFNVKLGQISTLTLGRITLLQDDEHSIYLTSDLPANSRPMPYIRLFFNKGSQVDTQNHLATAAFFMNETSAIQLWKDDLKAQGFQKGDTVSVIGYGDNYQAKELRSTTAFPCLSKESTNIVTFVLK